MQSQGFPVGRLNRPLAVSQTSLNRPAPGFLEPISPGTPLVSRRPQGSEFPLASATQHPLPQHSPIPSMLSPSGSHSDSSVLPGTSPFCILLHMISERGLGCLNILLWASKGPPFLGLMEKAMEQGDWVHSEVLLILLKCGPSAPPPPTIPACEQITPSPTCPSEFQRHGVLFQTC